MADNLSFLTSSEFYNRLKEPLELPLLLKNMQIKIEANEPVEVQVNYYVKGGEDGQEFLDAFEQLRLVKPSV